MNRPDSDAWFWTPEWQAGEREADADLAAGRSIRFDTDEEMDAYLALAASRDRDDEDLATGGIIPAGRTYLIGESDCCGSAGSAFSPGQP